MAKQLPNINYEKDSHGNPTVDSVSSPYKIPFFKDESYFQNYDNYVSFVKGVEAAVRGNDKYNKYIYYLKNEVKLDHCQVFKNITTEDEGVDIEMHHGPILTLYDVCAIVLEYFLLKKWKITTFRVANQVLEEHQRNRVLVVMVSATAHEEIHNGDIFINIKHKLCF